MTTLVKNEYRTPSHIAEAGATAMVVMSAPLAGTWVNIDSSTRDLVKVVITASGSGITVNPYGACVPNPCNWGSVAGTAYAANVSSSRAVAFSAEFDFGFSRITVVGHLHGSELLVETFTFFTDGSGRSDFYSTDTLKK